MKRFRRIPHATSDCVSCRFWRPDHGQAEPILGASEGSRVASRPSGGIEFTILDGLGASAEEQGKLTWQITSSLLTPVNRHGVRNAPRDLELSPWVRDRSVA